MFYYTSMYLLNWLSFDIVSIMQIKLRSQIATEQEKLLGEKDQELEKLRQDLASTKDNLRSREDEVTNYSIFWEYKNQKQPDFCPTGHICWSWISAIILYLCSKMYFENRNLRILNFRQNYRSLSV